MCGRFTLTQFESDIIQAAFGLAEPPPPMPPRYNIPPGTDIAVVGLNADHQPRLGMMRWGLIPSWAKDAAISNKLINARGETVAEKPSFRSAFKKRRCLIVSDGFYEWRKNPDGDKTPMYIHLKDHAVFGLAGLWERWQDPTSGESVLSCTIITTKPNSLVESIHNRMPAIIPPEYYADWLAQETPPDALHAFIQPYDAERMTAYAVSSRVNSPKHDSPELIQSAE